MTRSRSITIKWVCLSLCLLLLAPALVSAGEKPAGGIGALAVRLARMVMGDDAEMRPVGVPVLLVGRAGPDMKVKGDMDATEGYRQICSIDPSRPGCGAQKCKGGDRKGEFCTGDFDCPGSFCSIPPGHQTVIQ